MSIHAINVLWTNAQKDLEVLAVNDYETQALEPEFDRTIAQRTAYELYVKYILISNRLEQIYDQILQTQKRILIKKLLDGCLGRILELKYDLVNIDMMEFSYNDEIMTKLNLIPQDIELKIPRYFQREREQEIRDKNKFIEDLMLKLGWIDQEVIEEKLTELQAIRIIQMHERARQGRLRAQFMKEIKILKEKGKPDSARDKTDGLLAAMRIQKSWRGFTTRRKIRRKKMNEMVLIGMIPDTNVKSIHSTETKFTDMCYQLQLKYQRNYEESIQQIKNDINKKQGIHINQEITDEVRTWIKNYQVKTGKLPDFPSEEHGGSRHLLSRQASESELSRSSASSKKTKDKSKTIVKSGDLNVEDNFDKGFKITQSSFLPEIKIGIDEFNDIWRAKEDKLQNPKQSHYEDIIYSDCYNEIEMELRKIIDDMMRQELELLQTALDRDRSQKGKKSKKSSKKTRRSGKKSKKKKEKDLTPDRTTESLFEELVTNGIIKKYPQMPIATYLGERAYVKRSGLQPTPGDIRQVIIEYCILPLGSEAIHNFAPCIKSLLITGPKGSGKKRLINSICTEIGAILFDLTPANIVGKYPGKSGLIMLMHLISKVSRLLQPSIIFMDDAERPFMKKVQKGDRTDPKRLKKDLPKLIKNITPEDQILFIGISNAPWEADQKLFQQTYNRFIYIPRPDYGTLSYVWRELLSEYIGEYIDFDTGAMAKISDGYTIGSIVQCIKEVITCKRKLQLKVQPLTHLELINSLSNRDPVYREEEDAFTGWWSKTPLGRRKQKIYEMELEAKLEKEAENGKGKKKAVTVKKDKT